MFEMSLRVLGRDSNGGREGKDIFEISLRVLSRDSNEDKREKGRKEKGRERYI